MTYASLIHIETGVEYYKNDNLFYPSANEKLLWTIFGTPDDIKMIVQTFETEIDNYTGSSKKEVQAKVNKNFKDGLYNFLPSMGVNHNIEIRWGK